VVNFEPLPQPAAGAATEVGGGDADAGVGVGVDVPVALVPPPQAASVVNTNAAPAYLISPPCHSVEPVGDRMLFRLILMAAFATMFYVFRQDPTCFRTPARKTGFAAIVLTAGTNYKKSKNRWG
jgi:hypothetical protein